MKIFIDKKANHTLAKRLKPIWIRDGHKILETKKGADIQLAFIRQYTKSNLPIVQRLDGIYYNLDNNPKKQNRGHSVLHRTASGIIYQSKYSKKLCEKHLKSRQTKIIDVIYNGIPDNWSGEFHSHNGFNIVSSAKWRRPKRLKETVKLFLEFHKNFPDSHLHILGKLVENKKIIHPNITYYGMVNWKEMKKIYQISDVFIHLCKRDSCPNAVVEAIGSGIPIITTNGTGGSAEMAKLTKGCYVCDGDDVSYELAYPYREEFNRMPRVLEKNILRRLREVYHSRHRVKLPEQLNINYTAEAYINLFRRVLNGKT